LRFRQQLLSFALDHEAMPKCSSHNVQKGRFAGKGALFRPDGLTPCTFPWSNGEFCNDEACACLDSGLVWSSIASLDRLREFISKRCKQER